MKKLGIGSFLLLPISFLYYFCFKARHAWTAPYKSSSKIICIGNVTAGGAGKTPTALMIGKILKKNDKTFCYLVKGYKGLFDGPLLANTTNHTARSIGDEAMLLAKHGYTIVAKDRVAGIKFAEKRGFKTIIVDDGFQNPTFKKDISILVIDSEFGFGNGLLLPAGPLREKVTNAIQKADLINIIGNKNEMLESKVSNPEKIIHSHITSLAESLPKKVTAFAAIALPDKFFHTLETLGVEIVEAQKFTDHHHYTDEEIERLIELAEKNNTVLMTTEKDIVKIHTKYHDKIKYLPISLQCSEIQKIEKLVL